MSKTYKGYELIKAIADGEIKDGIKVKCLDNKKIYSICYNNILIPEEGQDFIENDFGASIWIKFDFELIEDNTIDIDSINNTNLRFVLCRSDLKDDNIINVLNNFFKENDDNMDKLLKCIKQLNKEIKELKEE